MKRIILFCVAVILMLAVLAGCGQKQISPSNNSESDNNQETDEAETVNEAAEVPPKSSGSGKFEELISELMLLYPHNDLPLYESDYIKSVALSISVFDQFGLNNSLLVQYKPKINPEKVKEYYILLIETEDDIDSNMISGEMNGLRIVLTDVSSYTSDETFISLNIIFPADRSVPTHVMMEQYWDQNIAPMHESFDEESLITKHIQVDESFISVTYAYSSETDSEQVLDYIEAKLSGYSGFIREDDDYGTSMKCDIDSNHRIHVSYEYEIYSIKLITQYK